MKEQVLDAFMEQQIEVFIPGLRVIGTLVNFDNTVIALDNPCYPRGTAGRNSERVIEWVRMEEDCMIIPYASISAIYPYQPQQVDTKNKN